MTRRWIAILLGVTAMPFTVAAQESAQSPQPRQGPMTIERVDNGFAIAPDFKVTRLQGASVGVAGVYGGWVLDHALLFGGGAYWLTNRSSPSDLAYGGAVVEWRQFTDHRLGFSARGLAGVGQANTTTTVMFADGHEFSGRVDGDDTGNHEFVSTFRRRNTFFLAEPQVDLVWNMTRVLHLHGGIGYRLTTSGTSGTDRLDGVSSSVSLQIGK
jgi:hypothetical protein